MKFDIDKQTINDLELFEKIKGDKSIFSLFNFTKTIGGRECLRYMFSNPFADKNSIESRILNIKFFQEQSFEIPLDKGSLDFIEHYLSRGNRPVKFSIINSFINKWFFKKNANEQFIIQRGIQLLISFLVEIYDFIKNYNCSNNFEFIDNCKSIILESIENSSLKIALDYKDSVRLYHYEYSKLDYYFRNTEFNNIRKILDIIYEIDAYKSISIASNKNEFTLPIITNLKNSFQVKGLYHPFLKNPVDNDFEISEGKNICFLTGPNMAGKSTFLKSLGVSIYLSHIGFPVPAKYLETSVFNGLLTTINLSDNLNKGYSHFYNEVLRVKYVAERISQNGNIFVVFDELFRGTNVKDAFEASLSVIQAFSKINKGAYAISTHIIEIADKLDPDSILFKYFEANLINEAPQYNYKIKDGVTDERIGMYILKKERVIETIEKAKNKQ
jgi:DNA mismatch repair protein MutS